MEPSLSQPQRERSGDAVDGIILREAASLLSGAGPDAVAVLDDTSGELTKAAADLAGGLVRVYCDSLESERLVAATADQVAVPVRREHELGAGLLQGVRVVLLRLPKSLAALDEIAEAVACCAGPQVHLVAAGRVKHMTLGMNRVLERHFTSVTASLGQQKSRVLTSSGPRPTARLSYPRDERHDDLDLSVCAHGAAFAGTSVDLGTRFLLSCLAGQWPEPVGDSALSVADLGCGTGVLAATAARRMPTARVQAVDESTAACRSAEATARRNGVESQVAVRRAHLLSGTPDRSIDLVLCNPPFHRGTARDSDVAFAMFAESARVLRPGGELWTVHNTHLPYLPALRRLVGPTRVSGQNPSYVVTRSASRA